MNLKHSNLSECQRQNSTLTHIPSGSSHLVGNSRVDNYVLKLENMCREHSKKIKANRPTIQQLECQRRFFKRICEKQKEKLQGVNIEMIRQQYQAELATLRVKRQQLHEMIASIHDEAEERKENCMANEKSLGESRQFLQQSLQEIYSQNRRYRELLQKKLEILANDRAQIQANNELIKDKQKIQEKYRMVCQEIQSKQDLKKQSGRQR